MAWYAELKRRKWYCINAVDMIHWYKCKLYNDWYNSLTDEQKQQLEEYQTAKAEKNRREAREALQRLLLMSAMVGGLYRIQEKYHGVYDDFGFPLVENSLGGCNAITRLLHE